MEKGFDPVFDVNSEILILGSFPSVASRKEGFYYGNKQNRFWKMIALAYNCALPQNIDEKRALILGHNLALWDVVASCDIEGSLDENIKNYQAAAIDEIFAAAKIKKILLNGGKAYDIFVKTHPHLINIAKKMQSTSPRNAHYDVNQWLKELQ